MSKLSVKSLVPGGPVPKEVLKCSLDMYYDMTGVESRDIPSSTAACHGYMLRWSDGVATWVDETTFACMYRVEITPEETYDFGRALEVLRHGGRVARQGWNGKDMFIYLNHGSTIDTRALRASAKEALGDKITGNNVKINGHIDMYAADGSIVVGWLASQTDMLACDWYTVD